jgi:hypothetical protein
MVTRCDFVEILLRICDENRCVILLRIIYMLRSKVVEIGMVKNMKFENRNILILDIDVAGGAVGIEPSSRPEQPRSRPGR